MESIESGFIAADVIRWKEGVFERHGQKQVLPH
jgi:hypothetical protein